MIILSPLVAFSMDFIP